MSDSVTPEDLEQNFGPFIDQHTQAVGMEDPRRVSMTRIPAIDLGRAIILDREISGTETILRVKLDDKDPYNQDRRRPSLQLDSIAVPYSQNRRMSSAETQLDSIAVPYSQNRRMSSAETNTADPPAPTSKTLERRNSSPSRLERDSYVNVDSPSMEPPRTSYVTVDPASLDPTRSTYDYPRQSYVNVDEPEPDSMIRPNFVGMHRRSSSPPLNQEPRTSFVSVRRVSSPSAPLKTPRRPSSPMRVDSARPSLSVFRFKQTAANGGGNLPPRSPSPGRRMSSSDVSSSVLKPTYNSARRSTIMGNFYAEKNRSSDPVQSPGRRTSTGDVPSTAGQPKYHSRRRTTTGDISMGKLTGKDAKRLSRMPFAGNLGAVVLSWTNLSVKSR